MSRSRAAYMRGLRRKRRGAGLCCHCASQAVDGMSSCLKCWFGNMAWNHLGRRRYSDHLQELWEKQGGLCAYTGEVLVPGLNASLDHRDPIKGVWKSQKERTAQVEKNGLPALQWVTKSVNRAKTDLGHEGFIQLCKMVSARFGTHIEGV